MDVGRAGRGGFGGSEGALASRHSPGTGQLLDNISDMEQHAWPSS